MLTISFHFRVIGSCSSALTITRACVLFAMVARQPKKLEKKLEQNAYKTKKAWACACVYACVCVLSAIYPPIKEKNGNLSAIPQAFLRVNFFPNTEIFLKGVMICLESYRKK